MSDLLLEDRLTTADIARPATPRQARAAAMDQGPESASPIPESASPIVAGTPGQWAADSGATSKAYPADTCPLFPEDELHNFRARWDEIQASFVDEPRHAVEHADSLVANVVKRIAEQFSAERARLEEQWGHGDNVSTEDLRQALRRYRSFFDRLLTF